MANNLPDDFLNAVITLIETVAWDQANSEEFTNDDIMDALTIAANYVGFDLNTIFEDSDNGE